MSRRYRPATTRIDLPVVIVVKITTPSMARQVTATIMTGREVNEPTDRDLMRVPAHQEHASSPTDHEAAVEAEVATTLVEVSILTVVLVLTEAEEVEAQATTVRKTIDSMPQFELFNFKHSK